MSDRQSSSPSSFSMSSLYSNLPDRFAAALAAFIGADRGQSPPPTDAWKIRFPCITANLEQLSVSATISSSSDEIRCFYMMNKELDLIRLLQLLWKIYIEAKSQSWTKCIFRTYS